MTKTKRDRKEKGKKRQRGNSDTETAQKQRTEQLKKRTRLSKGESKKRTLTSDVPSDTTAYEIAPTPENSDRETAQKQGTEQSKKRIRLSKEEWKKRRRENYKYTQEEKRNKVFSDKGNFKTLTSDVPSDTTAYEIAPTPETGVINWYQCGEKWRLQWLMEDIQDLQSPEKKGNGEQKTDEEIECDKRKALELMEELKKRILNEEVTPEKQRKAADEFFVAMGRGCSWGTVPKHDVNSVDARLFGCAACGMKEYDNAESLESAKKGFERIPLSQLEKSLKMKPEAAKEYNERMKQNPVQLINEDGNVRNEVNPWRVLSVYTHKNVHYHMHPELVLDPSDTNSIEPIAIVCANCATSVHKGEVPKHSIASNVDFGLANRIELEDLTERELQMLALVRHYYNIYKIESNSRRLREHQQSAIKGSSILFEHEAPYKVSNLLSPETMTSNVFLHFVGPKGEFDALFKKLMRTKSADVFGRSWVMFNWLTVLHRINPQYQNIVLPDTYKKFEQTVATATESFITNSLKTYDENVMQKTDVAKDDIAGVRATTNPNMQVNHESSPDFTDADCKFALKHSYLASTNVTSHNSGTDSTHAYMLNAAKTFGINVEADRAEYDKAKSFRADLPVNEFSDGELPLVGAFPNVFMLGKAYDKEVCNVNLKDCVHLLMQFSAVPAKCTMLLFYLFDVQRRHANIRGMSARRKANPKAFEEMSREIMSPAFQTKVQNAVAHPDSKDAKSVLNKLLPVLTTAGKHTSFGALELTAALGETYGLIRRFGPEFEFLTIAIDDVNAPQVMRLTFHQKDNVKFPSTASNEYLSAMKEGRVFAEGTIRLPTNWSALATAVTENPVASAFIYKRLIYNVVKILIGLKPSRLSDGRSMRKTSPTYTTESMNDEGGVIAGHAHAFNGVHEASGRGGLHAHLMIWSSICAALLQGVADMKEVCEAVTRALDTMFCATLPRQHHVKDLIEKELAFYGTSATAYEKKLRRGRAMLIPPDPTNTDDFIDFVHTGIVSFDIHSHDRNIKGRCHKPPKGITRCALSKPNDLVDKTKPVQLIDVTPHRNSTSEKITITYEVTEEIQDRQSAIKALPERKRVGPLFRENDPRLIVYEPKRPEIETLPEQNNASKEWLVRELSNAMVPYATHDTNNNNHPSTMQRVNWQWPMPNTLPINATNVFDPERDGNCQVRCFSFCLNERNTILDCYTMRREINDFLLNHPNTQLSAFIPTTVREWAIENLAEMKIPIDARNDPLLQYTELMRIVTPYTCHHCTTLEAFAFATIRNVNVVIYQLNSNNDETYQQMTYKLMDEKKPTICVLYGNNHYKALLPLQDTIGMDASSLSYDASSSFMNETEIKQIVCHLLGMKINDIQALYETVRNKLAKRNGFVVDYNPTLTAVLGCHTNALFLGSSQQAKAAAHYLGPYTYKNKTPLTESIEVVYESMEHAKKHPSIAEDSGTISRFVQYVLTRILNKLGSLIEVFDTQAAAALLGLTVSLSSESFTVCDTPACTNMIKNEQKFANTDRNYDNENTNDDYISEDSSDYELSDSEYEDNSSDHDMDDFIVPDVGDSHDNDNAQGGILRQLLESEDVKNDCTNSNTLLHKIKTTLDKTDEVLRSPRMKFYIDAYGTIPLYRIDDGNALVPVPYPHLYRYRGEQLKNLSRIEYFSTVQVRKDKPDENDETPPHLQYKRGRKRSKQYRFDQSLPIALNHHQTMMSKQCTPKFFRNTPPHPGQKPDNTDPKAQERWEKDAKKFAEFILVTFRPEPEACRGDQEHNYSYNWEDLEKFMTDLNDNCHVAINRFRLDYITSTIHNLRTTRRDRTILTNYRERAATRWSEEEQRENRKQYKKYKTRQVYMDEDDERNEVLDNQLRMGLSDNKQQEIVQKLAFADGLLHQLKNCVRKDFSHETKAECVGKSDDTKRGPTPPPTSTVHPVNAFKYDEKLAQRIMEKPSAENNTDSTNNPTSDANPMEDCGNDHAETTCATIEEKVNELIRSKCLSQDKLVAMEIMYKHFQNVRNGTAQNHSYKAPLLLITGGPGTGKSWLIDSITDLAHLMDLDTPIKTAFMGIAAINIDGCTLNSFLDVPLEMNAGNGTSKTTTSWDADKLQMFKQKYDIDNLTALIIDEISMVKPWMLAYLDERLKEARQIYDKPFGGVAVIMLGDFDQQPPIGGSSMPNLAVALLEKEYQSRHRIYYTCRGSRQKKIEINSSLCRRGVQLFQQAGLLKLTQQHRCPDDPEHMANLQKMSSGGNVCPKDLDLYRTVSASDLDNLDEFLLNTIIVTGNYERGQLNAFMAELWAKHFKTHIIRWKKSIRYSKWNGMPRTSDAIDEAEKQSCFYETFVPMCPAYLTNNLNLSNDLANGTLVREHSLAFDSSDEKAYLDEMIKNTPVGGIIDLPTPPTAINVELFPDFLGDSKTKAEMNAKMRKTWTHGSITDDGKVVVPINQKTIKYRTETIPGSGAPYYFNASEVPMADHFPMELAFCITIPKAQGRTIRKLIASVSEHPCPFLRFRWEQFFTLFSRITGREDLSLLLQLGNRNTLSYLSDLKKDAFTAHYFAGFPQASSTEVSYWNASLTAKAAGFTT